MNYRLKKGMQVLIAAVVAVSTVLLLQTFFGSGYSSSTSGIEADHEKEEANEDERRFFVKERMQYEFDMLKDPATGKIPVDIREKEIQLARSLPAKGISPAFRTTNLNNYIAAGPTNIGGRTRGVAYDVRYNGSTNRVIMAGSVSGGIMRSADGGLSWTRVSPEGDFHNVTCFAQDPRPGQQDVWYAGTGEAYGNSASLPGATYYGYGLFKSTDNGLTWSPLLSTRTGSFTTFERFDYIFRLAVHPINGDVYVACIGNIMRSQNGGNTFDLVKGGASVNNITGNTDVIINSSGTNILAAFHLKNTPDRGVWQSPNGNAGSWTLLGGNAADTPPGWKVNNSTANWGRILIELAPSNQDILYVMYENGLSQSGSNPVPEADLFKCIISSASWTNLSPNLPDLPGRNLVGSDPLALQGGYNMLLKVKPDNPNIVFVGGTNLYRSNDGFTSNANTAWIGGYVSTATSYATYPNSHPDIHNLVFDPTNTNRAICANDGGIQVTDDVSVATVTWRNLNNYQTLQYYYVDIDPTTGKNDFIGGAQDNGTTFRDSTLILGPRPPGRPTMNDHENIFGGDGVSASISNFHGGSQYIYYGAQSGSINRDNLTNYQTSIAGSIRPARSLLTSNGSTGFGEFVTRFELSPDNSDVLFYVNYNKLFKTISASSVDSSSWEPLFSVEQTVNPSGGTSVSIRALAFSRGPYLPSHAMYLGTTNGKIYRLDDYRVAGAATLPIDITPAALTGNVQDISVNPNDDNEIMAVVSNYSVPSIWWTRNAKAAAPVWYNAEGNLTIPSVRSCMIVTKKDAANQPVTEYYVGTSIGLYSAINIGDGATGGTPIQVNWAREGGNILNYAVVQSMSYRPADNVLLLGTHGNGMYYTSIGSPNFTPNIITGINTPIRNDKNFITKVFPTITSGSIINYQAGNMLTIKQVYVELINLRGQKIYQAVKGYQNGSVNISGLPPGAYILSITSSNRKQQFIQKFVKQ